MPLVHDNCLNCNETLRGSYCNQCGQRDRNFEPTTREWLRILWDDYIALDKKLLRTLKHLFVPGKLTDEWLKGHQQRYIQPFRLYVFITIIISVALQLSFQNVEENPLSDFTAGMLSSLFEKHPELTQNVWYSFINAIAAAAFVPLAAIAGGLYHRRRSYVVHCVFTAHLWLVLYLVFAINRIVIHQFHNLEIVKDLMILPSLVFVAVFIIMAARKVYALSWATALVRTALFIPFAIWSWGFITMFLTALLLF